MPMRLGEMVLIIRTQDFASRNLERVGANLGKLSKFQQLSRRQDMLNLRQARTLARRDTMRQEINALQQRVSLESRLGDLQRDRALLSKRLAGIQAASAATGQIRGAGGRFIGSAAPQIAQLQQSLADLGSEETRLTNKHNALMQNLAATAPALARLTPEQASARLGRLRTSLSHVDDELRIIQSDLALTNRALAQVKWERLHRVGQAMSRTGRVMQLTGLVATGSLVAMGNAAANFGQQITLAATQTRDIGAPISQVAQRSGQLQDAILDQMGRFPASAEDMSNAAYEIFSSLDLADRGRIQFWKGLQILEKTNRVAVAGGIDLGEAINGLVITLNNFDPTLSNVNETLDTMFDIVRFGNIRVSDFTQMMTKVAPAAKGVGHELEDVGGALAFLTQVMQPARVATGFSRLEDAFSNRDFIQGIKVVSKARIGKALDIEAPGGGLIPFMRILEGIREIFPELETGALSAQEFFKLVTSAGREQRIGRPSEGLQFTAEGRRAFTQLIQNMERVEELQRLIASNRGEFGRSFKAMADTPAVQWMVFVNALKAAAIEIGTDVLPALLGLAGMIRRGLEWWRGLSDETRNLIVRIALFAGVASLLGGILLSVVGGIISVVGAIALLSGGIGAGKAGVVGRIAVLLTLLRALTLIGAITIAIKLIVDSSQLDQLRGWIEENVPGGKKIVDVFGFSLTDAINKIRGVKKESEGLFNPDAELFPGGMSKETKQAMQSLRKAREEQDRGKWDKILGQASKDTLRDLKRVTGMSLDDLREQFGNTTQDAVNDAKQIAQAHANAIQQATENMQQKVETAANNLMRVWDELRQKNEQAFGSLFQGPQMTGIIGGVFSEINSQLRQFGIQIPVPFEILRRDMAMQLDYFKRWRSTLNKLLARGAPLEFVQQLEEMGPEAGLPIAEGLLQGGRKGFKNLLAEWRTGQKLIRQATQKDFDRQIDEWEKHGKDVAWALINGIISTTADAGLQKKFQTYVKLTYGPILRKEFKEEVDKAMKAAMADLAAQAKAEAKANARKRNAGGTTTNTVNNSGDRVTIHADGATPDAVDRALKKRDFRKKTSYPGPH